MTKKIFNIGGTRKEDINVDVDIYEVTEKKMTPLGFITSIYDVSIIKILGGFIFSAILLVGLITCAYGLLKPSGDLTITSTLAEDGNILFPKGWELTPALKNAIENGEISLNNITITTCGPEMYLSGGDSDKLAIIDYRTEIEDNEYPQIYSDEYFEKLKKQGRNTYVVKTLGLATEKEGAE